MVGPIVFIGDSITLGVRTGVVESDTFAHKIAASRNAAYINKGVSNDTTTGMLARFQADVLANAPSWVALMTENDAFPPGVSLAQSEANIRSMIETTLRAGANFVLMTPSMVRNTDSNPSTATEMGLLSSYLAMQRRVAHDYRIGLVDVSQAMEEAVTYSGLLLSNVLIDDWHLTPAGHTFVSDLLNRPENSALFLGVAPVAPAGWVTIFGTGGSTGESGGWTGYTSRTRFEAPSMSMAGASRIRVTAKAGSGGSHVGEMWAGHAPASGFGFASAPTQLSTGAVVAPNTSVVFDVPFSWQNAPLIVSTYETGAGATWVRVPTLAGASAEFKSGNDASDLSPSSYTTSSDASDLIVMVEALFA